MVGHDFAKKYWITDSFQTPSKNEKRFFLQLLVHIFYVCVSFLSSEWENFTNIFDNEAFATCIDVCGLWWFECMGMN